jgi:DNA polymerase III subunit delta
MDALEFLKAKAPKRHPVYALVGDEDFLKRQARERIIATALGEDDPAFAVSVFQGDKADKLDFSTIRNELDTLSFLASCRVVIVENADTFVTDHRPSLEAYAAKPNPDAVLVLDVKTFPETTKLAKALPDAAKVVCKAPPAYRLYDLKPWLVQWAKTAHKKQLAPDAAELLLDLVGPSMGLLDQELGKLAVAVGAKPGIAAEDVDRLVGRSKAADVFRILDAIGEGKPGEALSVLEALFAEGEHPLAILGPLTAQLRKLAAVGRMTFVEKLPLGSAMDAAGVPKWEKARVSFEKQLRHLGGRRLLKLLDWLVEINLGLKGGNPLPERVQVERLVVMLARPREDAVRK